jgi:hypothetical protein
VGNYPENKAILQANACLKYNAGWQANLERKEVGPALNQRGHGVVVDYAMTIGYISNSLQS